jgi:hypothetical protein
MSLRVTFDIFSGRPNPVVVLEGGDATALLQKLRPTAKLSGADAQAPPESILGYRGLIVEQVGPATSADVPQRVHVVDGKAFAPAAAYRVPGDVEDFVLERAEALHQPNAPGDVLAEIRTQATARRSNMGKTSTSTPVSPGPVPACACAPMYEPLWWNDGAQKQGSNNCYNYATNYRTDTFAQPGLGTGQMYSFPIASIPMSAAAVRDALVQTHDATCPKEGHLVALFIAPSVDFHWYRLGRDGLWTHKPGPTPVTNVDNSGALIRDPRTANRGIYTQFCSYMIVKHGHIKLR